MMTLEVPRGDWTRTFDEFSKRHAGWLVSIDVVGAELGAQPEVHELPLVGITAETTGDAPVIAITATAPGGDQMTHVVHDPTHVRIERTLEGADTAVEITAADSTASILRFRTVALPETVDGV